MSLYERGKPFLERVGTGRIQLRTKLLLHDTSVSNDYKRSF